MMQLVNVSPYAAEHFVTMDSRCEERLLVIVKATWDVSKGAPVLLEEQPPIQLADEYCGEPGLSSIKHAGEGGLSKPAVDLVFVGAAYTDDKDRTQVDVRFQVGDFKKTLKVFGDRRWEKGIFNYSASTPEAFDTMPLTWERAYGGTDQSIENAPASEPRNPVGVGFRGEKSELPIDGAPLPNVENPASLITSYKAKPEPAGLGFIAPHWQPRLKHAGTYDEAWMKSRSPLLPDDFDPQFFQTAPPDQIHQGELSAGTPVVIENASPSRRLSFSLPPTPLSVRVHSWLKTENVPMKLDTVAVDGEAERLTMILRGHISVHNRVYDVDWVEIQGRERT